jgi:1,4-alpha-glucan branching enzyme
MSAPKGYLALVLHAHLPFVRHPEHRDFLEEDWLYQAVTESYIPLLGACDSLVKEGVPFRLTLVITPPLLEMLSDGLLMSRYRRHLNRLIELAGREVKRTRKQPALNSLARMYRQRFSEIRRLFVRRYRGDLVQAIGSLRDRGHLVLFTSAATHAYLPLLARHPRAVHAQIRTALRCHRRHFGSRPDGIWLPECGYYPGLDALLQENGLSQFILDAHGIMFANPRPVFGTCAPILCPSGAAAFGRDRRSSWQVWSSQSGYPGDYDYRDYYRDIGFDLRENQLLPLRRPAGIPRSTGIKYHRITRKPGGRKRLYDPEKAAAKARSHAMHFIAERERHVMLAFKEMQGRPPPLLVCPYDAELFGHWWYEGPQFLDFMLRAAAANPHLECITLPEYLARFPVHQVANPAASSWGAGGYHRVWLNQANDWIYPHLHRATAEMTSLAISNPRARGLKLRVLKQSARELLLAQSSDWAFIMNAGTAVDDATHRTKDHLFAFETLSAQVRTGKVDRPALESLESRNNIFPDIDHRDFA